VWNNGEITQEPTPNAPGIKTYTCNSCGTTRTEDVPYQAALKAPSVSLKVSTNSSGRIVITGEIDDYDNLEDYYEITGRGILYIQSSRIGTRTLTVNTSGRTNVSFKSVNDNGSFTYTFKPTNKSTQYAFRAYLTYKDPTTGRSVTVYSSMIRGSYNTLK
jgi:hypothetical protein